MGPERFVREAVPGEVPQLGHAGRLHLRPADTGQDRGQSVGRRLPAFVGGDHHGSLVRRVSDDRHTFRPTDQHRIHPDMTTIQLEKDRQDFHFDCASRTVQKKVVYLCGPILFSYDLKCLQNILALMKNLILLSFVEGSGPPAKGSSSLFPSPFVIMPPC